MIITLCRDFNRFSLFIKATDTALLGLWVDSGDNANLNQLLESSNSCMGDICEQKLKDANKYYALSMWYKMKKQYGATLSIWKRYFVVVVVVVGKNASKNAVD